MLKMLQEEKIQKNSPGIRLFTAEYQQDPDLHILTLTITRFFLSWKH